MYVGITNNPERRECEHRSEGKGFSRMNIVGPAVTRPSAKKWEAKRLEQYRRSHGGKNPQHNQTET